MIEGKRFGIKPSMSIGKGGEADIYALDSSQVLKLFKKPDHPDYAGLPEEQAAAWERIALHQKKLPLFPAGLPEQVISPERMAKVPDTGEICGYTMKYIVNAVQIRQLASSAFSLIKRNDVISIFAELHGVLAALHRKGVIIGDFNDLNVLVKDGSVYLIDADSFQFGTFLCSVFTHRFLDPLLCEGASASLMLQKPYTEFSDWFAFSALLMQSLLYVGPYGGVYMPSDPSMRVAHDLRPLRRISVFHHEVKYPASALPLSVLPDDLAGYLREVFVNDRREAFPLSLITSLHWHQCSSCGRHHGRIHCPFCSTTIAAAAVKTFAGTVIVTRVFSTTGVIIDAAVHDGRFMWLYEEDGKFRREDGREVFSGTRRASMKCRIAGHKTLVAMGNRMVVHTPGSPLVHCHADTCDSLPVFDSNDEGLFLASRGRLLFIDDRESSCIGEVLEGQTRIWTGPSFGFGYYRAGQICRSFIFRRGSKSIDDRIDIPFLRRPILDTACFFTGSMLWLLLATQEHGRTIHRCLLISSSGQIEAQDEALQDDGSWLGNPLEGKCAAGDFLLVPTDDGIVRVERRGTSLASVKEFPGTAGPVNRHTRLFPGKGGIYGVSCTSIDFIQLK